MTDLETRLREVPRDGGDRGRHAGDRRRGGRGAAAVATTVFTLGGELHPDETSAGISFVDHEGKGHAVNVGVTGKLTVSRNMLPLAQACSLRGAGAATSSRGPTAARWCSSAAAPSTTAPTGPRSTSPTSGGFRRSWRPSWGSRSTRPLRVPRSTTGS